MDKTAQAGFRRNNEKQRQVLLAVVSCCIIGLLLLLGGEALGQPTFRKALRPKPIPPDREFTIISAGDIMMHSPQTKAGWNAESKSYDFSFMFEKVAPILQEGDLVIGNLETPLAGEANGGFTGYPMFNAPEILAKNLKDAGFTLVSTANNHSLDRRHQGLLTTLDHLDEVGLLHTGTYRTPEESERVLYLEIERVRIALIAATYGTNGLTLPGEHSYAVNYIDEARLLTDIQRARAKGAQYVIVMLHWGIEYQPNPSREQTTLAMHLLQGGADLILGNHPHVLQRGEMVSLSALRAYPETEEEEDDTAVYPASGKSGHRFVMYSQGNFISNQEGTDRLSSILLKLTVGVDGATGEPYLKECGYIPIYTQRKNRMGSSRHTVWPLEVALEMLSEGGADVFSAEDRASMPKAWERIQQSQPALDCISLKDSPLWETLTKDFPPVR